MSTRDLGSVDLVLALWLDSSGGLTILFNTATAPKIVDEARHMAKA